MKVKIKKIHKDAIIPKYAKQGDAALDLIAVTKEIIDKGDFGFIHYGIGLAFEIPEGYVGLIFPRSSISNTGAILSNSVGVIDSGYRGEISARFKQISGTIEYNIGDKIAQIIIIPYPSIELEEVEELSSSERGNGSYGSTGN